MMNMMDGEDRGKRERASEDISDENKASGEIKGRDDTGTAITSALHDDEKEGKKSKKQKMNKSALTWDDIFPSRAQGPFSNDNNDGSKTSIREQDVKRYQQDDVHDNDNALKDKQNELIYNNKTTTIGNDDNQELTSMDTNPKDHGDKIDVVVDDVDAHKMGKEEIEENDNDNDGSNTKGFAVGGANNAQLSEPSKPKELDGEDQDSHGHNGNIDDGYENGDEEEDDDDGDDDDIDDDDDGKKSDSKNGQSLWTLAEDKLILELQKKLGNKWVEMCPFLPGRTKNQIKTRFRSLSRASKRLWTKEEDQMLIDLRSRTKLNDWGKIAEHFPGRTKNAVKVRFRELMDSKLGDIPPPAPGSPRQALIGRDEKVPSYTGSGRRENKLEQILKGSKQNHQQQNEPELGRLKVSGISSSNSSSNNSVSSGSGNSHGRASSSNSNNEHHGNNHGDMRKHEVVQSPSKSDKSLSPTLITPNIPILQTGNTNNMFMSPMQHFQSFLQYQQHQNGTTSTTGGAPTGAATATNAFAYGNGQMQGMPMLGLMPGSNMPVMMLMVPMPSSNGSNNTMFNVSMMGNHINSNNNNNSIAQQQQQQQQQQMMMMSTLMKDNNSSNSNLYHQEPNAISNNVNNNKTI